MSLEWWLSGCHRIGLSSLIMLAAPGTYWSIVQFNLTWWRSGTKITESIGKVAIFLWHLILMSRAKHLGRGKGDYGTGKMGDDVICVQIHGDAALAGQVLDRPQMQAVFRILNVYPASWFLPIPDPGSRIPDRNNNNQRGRRKNFYSH
jgi:hypothetical protein